MKTYTYNINLNERGSFYATVCNEQGKVVFEIRGGNELSENESSIVDDGYMKHFEDVRGLNDYLIELGIMNKFDKLLMVR